MTAGGQAGMLFGDMTFAVTNLALSAGSNVFSAVLTDPFGRAATSTVAVTVRDTGYGYDANGNLTNDWERAYAWDEENRLIEVRDVASGLPLIQSRYDGLSRRRERVQWVDGVGSTNRYVYDNWNVLRVLDGADNVLESYVHGPDLSGSIGGAGGIGGILSVAHEDEPEPWRFYHADGNGNVLLITDETEQETARLEYDPFGRVLINSGGVAVRYQFSSKEYDSTVGLNYYGYRFYTPGLGRWLNRDPLGDESFHLHYSRAMSPKEKKQLRREALNPGYLYVRNNPISNHDLYGLTTCPCGVSTLCCLCAASQGAAAWSPDSGNENPANNAQRHCIANCLTYRACGAECAEDFWDGNENPDSSSGQQDLHNNLIGRAAGETTGGCWELCQQAHDDGLLMCDGSTGAMCE